MIQIISMCVIMMLALVLLNGFVNHIAGCDQNGQFGKAMEGCMTIIVLYFLIIGMFGSGFQFLGVPFVDCMDQYSGMRGMFEADKGAFFFECAELISLTFVIAYVSNWVPAGFGGSSMGFSVIRSVVVVLAGLLLNNFLLSAISETFLLSWGVSAIQSFWLGTSVILTPAMVIGSMLNMDPSSRPVAFIVKKLPNTKLGRSISSATNSSFTFIIVLMLFESYFGSITGMVGQLQSLLVILGTIAVMFMGISLMIKSITR